MIRKVSEIQKANVFDNGSRTRKPVLGFDHLLFSEMGVSRHLGNFSKSIKFRGKFEFNPTAEDQEKGDDERSTVTKEKGQCDSFHCATV